MLTDILKERIATTDTLRLAEKPTSSIGKEGILVRYELIATPEEFNDHTLQSTLYNVVRGLDITHDPIENTYFTNETGQLELASRHGINVAARAIVRERAGTWNLRAEGINTEVQQFLEEQGMTEEKWSRPHEKPLWLYAQLTIHPSQHVLDNWRKGVSQVGKSYVASLEPIIQRVQNQHSTSAWHYDAEN